MAKGGDPPGLLTSSLLQALVPPAPTSASNEMDATLNCDCGEGYGIYQIVRAPRARSSSPADALAKGHDPELLPIGRQLVLQVYL